MLYTIADQSQIGHNICYIQIADQSQIGHVLVMEITDESHMSYRWVKGWSHMNHRLVKNKSQMHCIESHMAYRTDWSHIVVGI